MPASMLSSASVFSSSGSSLSRMPLMYVPKTPSSVLRACSFLLSQTSKEFAAIAIDPEFSRECLLLSTSEMKEGVRLRLVATASKLREYESHFDTERHSPAIESVTTMMGRTFGQRQDRLVTLMHMWREISTTGHEGDFFSIKI